MAEPAGTPYQSGAPLKRDAHQAVAGTTHAMPPPLGSEPGAAPQAQPAAGSAGGGITGALRGVSEALGLHKKE